MTENFTCEACGGTFASKQELEAHVKKEHAQPSEPTTADQKKQM